MKSLEGILVDSNNSKRQQILFDEREGIISEVGDLKIPRERIDFYFDDECLVFAGMGDVHVHAREDVSQQHIYKEDFLTASNAALNGGVTYFCDMPNNPLPPVDDKSYIAKLNLTRRGLIPILLYAGIGPGTRPLSQLVPYKVYIGPSIGDLFFRSNSELQEVLQYYQGHFVSFHCEDPEILNLHHTKENHEERRPIQAEVIATETAIKLIEKYQLNGKLCHFSSSAGLEKIRAARKRGIQIGCEVTPQHLYFNQESLFSDQRIFFQMNPPIRNREDQEAMLAALKEGELDYLATDHAPHALSEKVQGISGLTGLDTYGAFVTWLIVEKKISPLVIAKICVENPGSFVNRFLPTLEIWNHKKYGKGFGKFESGFFANFTVLNLRRSLTITSDNLMTKVRWSPFEGRTFPGQVEAVFIGGQLVIRSK